MIIRFVEFCIVWDSGSSISVVVAVAKDVCPCRPVVKRGGGYLQGTLTSKLEFVQDGKVWLVRLPQGSGLQYLYRGDHTPVCGVMLLSRDTGRGSRGWYGLIIRGELQDLSPLTWFVPAKDNQHNFLCTDIRTLSIRVHLGMMCLGRLHRSRFVICSDALRPPGRSPFDELRPSPPCPYRGACP